MGIRGNFLFLSIFKIKTCQSCYIILCMSSEQSHPCMIVCIFDFLIFQIFWAFWGKAFLIRPNEVYKQVCWLVRWLVRLLVENIWQISKNEDFLCWEHFWNASWLLLNYWTFPVLVVGLVGANIFWVFQSYHISTFLTLIFFLNFGPRRERVLWIRCCLFVRSSAFFLVLHEWISFWFLHEVSHR